MKFEPAVETSCFIKILEGGQSTKNKIMLVSRIPLSETYIQYGSKVGIQVCCILLYTYFLATLYLN